MVVVVVDVVVVVVVVVVDVVVVERVVSGSAWGAVVPGGSLLHPYLIVTYRFRFLQVCLYVLSSFDNWPFGVSASTVGVSPL